MGEGRRRVGVGETYRSRGYSAHELRLPSRVGVREDIRISICHHLFLIFIHHGAQRQHLPIYIYTVLLLLSILLGKKPVQQQHLQLRALLINIVDAPAFLSIHSEDRTLSIRG